MIDGPTPLHLIEKPSPGSGATLMVDAVATILTGSGASVMSPPAPARPSATACPPFTIWQGG